MPVGQTSSPHVLHLHYHCGFYLHHTPHFCLQPRAFTCPPIPPRNIINNHGATLSSWSVMHQGLGAASKAHSTGRLLPVPCTRFHTGGTCGAQTDPLPTPLLNGPDSGNPCSRRHGVPAARAVALREPAHFFIQLEHSMYYIYY